MEKDPCPSSVINNDFYEDLEERWYTAEDHPIALLRAENEVRAPWVSHQVRQYYQKPVSLLDVGCGAGFLSNHLAKEGHLVTGIDLSLSSLNVAKRHDATSTATYLYADAYKLPFHDASFDVVCAMDILEHVEKPSLLIQEAARVLKPGGLFFFHTFNRTRLSQLIVIKGVDWFVPNAPKNMHVYELFITPDELKQLCAKEGLRVEFMTGFMPDIWKTAFWKLIFFRQIDRQLRFKFVNNLLMGYCGFAIK